MEKEIQEIVAGLSKAVNDKMGELGAWRAKHDEQMTAFSKVTDEVKNAIGTLSTQIQDINAKILDVQQKAHRQPGGPVQAMTLGKQFVESDVFKAHANGGFKGQSADIIVNLTRSDGGLTVRDTRPGIIGPGEDLFAVRSLIAPGTTSGNAVEYTKETLFTNNAAPVAEGDLKPTSVIKFSQATANVKTIAQLLTVSRQQMADVQGLQSYLDSRMMYGLSEKEENQLLNGDGTGENLSGLITNATAYDTSLAVAGETVLDRLANAALQVRLTNFPANGIVMHPIDVNNIRKMKDSLGRYMFADPGSASMIAPWGLRIVESTAIPSGKFLLGAFHLASQIFDRETMTLDMSESDKDNFSRNMVTIRCEERLALAVYRPAAIVYGDLTDGSSASGGSSGSSDPDSGSGD